MEFIIRRTSDELNNKPLDKAYIKGDEWHINIENLEQLIALTQKEADAIIINDPTSQLPILEIYDDYRE